MSEQIKIDKNIPIPSNPRYPFEKLKVGDSFLATSTGGLGYWANKMGWKFRTRKENDKIRIWRIA